MFAVAKRKNIDKIRACAMVIVTISSFRKKRHRVRVCETKLRLVCAGPGVAWGRGRYMRCPAVCGAMAVSIFATADISRDFCG